jgi:hypothetical protein
MYSVNSIYLDSLSRNYLGLNQGLYFLKELKKKNCFSLIFDI